MAQRILESELLLTSSLHGLIFADALGVPVKLVRFTAGAAVQPEFKYEDYQSVYDHRTTFVDLGRLVGVDGWKSRTIASCEERASHVAARGQELIGEMFRRTAQYR
jgi:hypothetical protein